MEEKWLEFNDSNISVFETKELSDESFGNLPNSDSKSFFDEWSWGPKGHDGCKNAYILIYERVVKN